MRRITMALAATSTGIALVIGVKAQSAGAPRSALAVNAGPHAGVKPGARPSAEPGASAGAAPGASTGARPGASAVSGGFTGTVVDTRYGPVQVRAVLAGGRITDVVVLQETDGGRSRAIDSYALPILRSEVLAAQGANIDVVSGATYTSSGYAQSLQAALDRAGRG
ncbi:FMN-binding protein [Streptacidiphilus sp. N1-3]|uniref:FMN-binding protein n=1 Tax=Streptacidiphilus alkalitolerans TaxID=3342712 RepID=A0ABV6WXD7_9ACTN